MSLFEKYTKAWNELYRQGSVRSVYVWSRRNLMG